MKLTIGMACFDDYHGVAFSLQSLVMHQKVRDLGVELIVVDNNPNSRHGQETRLFCEKPTIQARYIPMPGVSSTTQPRQRIFDEATGDAVLVMDCHILYPTGTIQRLRDFYLNPNVRADGLFHGPIMLDSGGCYTHFNDQWRAWMWGTWGVVWRCKCRLTTFTPIQHSDRVEYYTVSSPQEKLTGPLACSHCGQVIPGGQWAGHERALINAGFQPHGWDSNNMPFEIPGSGLGIFTCRKDCWLGFNQHFQGFGGEEMYIHEKYRRAGRQVMCLPFLQYWHRFGRPDGVRYNSSLYNRVRNYVLGFQELDLPITPIYDHFVALDYKHPTLADHLIYEHAVAPQEVQTCNGDETCLQNIHQSKLLGPRDWVYLMQNPIEHVAPSADSNTGPVFTATLAQPPESANNIEAIYEWCRTNKRDLDEHLPKLRELAAGCKHVTEFTKRRESTVAFLAAGPTFLVSYQQEMDALLPRLHKIVSETIRPRSVEDLTSLSGTHNFQTGWQMDTTRVNINPTELLYIDSVHNGEHLIRELDHNIDKVSHYLILRGTGHCGHHSEDRKGPGLFHGMKWLLEKYPDWFVIYHTTHQYRLTVLSRDPADKPDEPIYPWPPGFGPGTELHAILAELGITPTQSCDCRAKAEQMDRWGVAGCTKNRDLIVTWLQDGQTRWGWAERFATIGKAGVNSILSGLAFKLNPLDPYPGIVDEAIRRASSPKKAEGSHVA